MKTKKNSKHDAPDIGSNIKQEKVNSKKKDKMKTTETNLFQTPFNFSFIKSMDHNFILSLILFLFLFNQPAIFAQWSNITPSNYGCDNITFVEDSICIVQTSSNYINKSTDAGQSWNAYQISSVKTQYNLYFINKNDGYAITDDGFIYSTSNGGVLWSFHDTVDLAQSLIANKYTLTNVCFINKDTGFVSFKNSSIGPKTYICKTSDGGENWTSSMVTGESKQLYFIDNFIGFLVTDDYIYRTDDCGSSWTAVLGGSSYYFGPYGGSRYLQFVNATEGFLVDAYGHLYKSTDAGLNWNIFYTNTQYEFAQLSFVDEKNGFMGGPHYGHIYKTDDGGITWNINSFPEDSIFGLYFSNENLGYAIGAPGRLYKTSNGGVDTIKNVDVWPGDANGDKTADVYDALNIGLAYGEIGTVRSNASLTWAAQPATDWTSYFNSLVNHKHADCDGNGSIDVYDGLAILQNYGLTHLKNSASTLVDVSTNDPYLYVDLTQDSVGISTSVNAPIVLGSSTQQAYNVYGIAFSINYDKDLVDSGSVSVSFANSWLGTEGVDLMGMYKDIPSAGRVDVAIVRTDHANKTGYGDVGSLDFVTTDNVSGKTVQEKTLNFSISNVKMIASDETILGVNTLADSLIVYDLLAGINKIDNANINIKLYPNPITDEIAIFTEGAGELKSIFINNTLGQIVREENVHGKTFAKIDVQSIKAGVYTMQIVTTKGTIVKKILLKK